MKISFYATPFAQLSGMLESHDLNPQAARTLHNWHLKKKENGFCPGKIAKKSRKFLASTFNFCLPIIDQTYESTDRTIKFLIRLEDRNTVETVLLPFQNKYTICLSSQVGCGMKCTFCYTGTQGLSRHLTADEIVGQYLLAWRWLKVHRPGEERILNIVFMGQGEPLHNFSEVKTACEIFCSTHGLSIGRQKITISTSGHLPGIRRWTKEMPQVNLALSLHSPFTAKRNELIPTNRKFPLKDVIEEIDKLQLLKKQFVTYEYLIIDGFNDSALDAHETGRLLFEKKAYVNLIPFNPFPGTIYKRPNLKKVEAFKVILDSYNLPTLIRKTKGDDVLAACGQLNTADKKQIARD